MVTFIEVIVGADLGSRFKVIEGLTIGRSGADIVIKDPKISSMHAQFELDGKGMLCLMDLDSSNGLHINGRRVKKVALIPGVIFEVGRTQFKVIVVEEEVAAFFTRKVTWRTIIQDNLASAADKADLDVQVFQSFSPTLRLQFIQGIQTDEEITLGYGPRRAGADSLDIELLDQDAPKEAFELIPVPGAVQLKVLAQGRVTLNKRSVTAEILGDGDLISVGDTVIKVTYL